MYRHVCSTKVYHNISYRDWYRNARFLPIYTPSEDGLYFSPGIQTSVGRTVRRRPDRGDNSDTFVSV